MHYGRRENLELQNCPVGKTADGSMALIGPGEAGPVRHPLGRSWGQTDVSFQSPPGRGPARRLTSPLWLLFHTNYRDINRPPYLRCCLSLIVLTQDRTLGGLLDPRMFTRAPAGRSHPVEWSSLHPLPTVPSPSHCRPTGSVALPRNVGYVFQPFGPHGRANLMPLTFLRYQKGNG
jgi:hypothetical protein